MTRQLSPCKSHALHLAAVTAKRLTNFRLEDELLEDLSLVKDRDGIPLTEQVTGIRQSAITYHRYWEAALDLALEPDLRPPFH